MSLVLRSAVALLPKRARRELASELIDTAQLLADSAQSTRLREAGAIATFAVRLRWRLLLRDPSALDRTWALTCLLVLAVSAAPAAWWGLTWGPDQGQGPSGPQAAVRAMLWVVATAGLVTLIGPLKRRPLLRGAIGAVSCMTVSVLLGYAAHRHSAALTPESFWRTDRLIGHALLAGLSGCLAAVPIGRELQRQGLLVAMTGLICAAILTTVHPIALSDQAPASLTRLGPALLIASATIALICAITAPQIWRTSRNPPRRSSP